MAAAAICLAGTEDRERSKARGSLGAGPLVLQWFQTRSVEGRAVHKAALNLDCFRFFSKKKKKKLECKPSDKKIPAVKRSNSWGKNGLGLRKIKFFFWKGEILQMFLDKIKKMFWSLEMTPRSYNSKKES
jgi:hypothetical protein